jgi:S1-C subfamily serine protease
MIMKRRTVFLTFAAMALALAMLLAGCAGNNEGSRNVVYDDMKTAFEQSGLISANIGVFSKTEKDGNVSYGECGSGVIIKKDGGTYYALTAAHVVSVENAQLLVFTTNTEMKSENIPGVDLNVLTPETYDAMYTAKIEYVSKRDDLAIISFQADEDLAVITLADKDPEKNDRIMCVGNPQNEWFAVSYGKITSGIEKFGETQGFPSNAMKHSAYIQVGSSGGAAFNEQMQLAGTTPGGSFSLDGKSFNYGVMIPVSEIKICFDEWDNQ